MRCACSSWLEECASVRKERTCEVHREVCLPTRDAKHVWQCSPRWRKSLVLIAFAWDTERTRTRLSVDLVENRRNRNFLISLMPKRGLEPPRAFAHMTLNHARLPIPPLRQRSQENIDAFAVSCNAKSRRTGEMSIALGYIQLYGYSGPIRWARTGCWRPLTCISTVS